MKSVFWLATASAGALLSGTAWAQEAPHTGAHGAVPAVETGVIPYSVEFFAAARPNTAFDMIQRLPGFAFDGGDNARGFAGNAGNVLIDGERPTIKSESLSDVLTRIPASQVERIDLIRGGAPGVDMQGRTVVANVIRKRVDTFQQTLSLGANVFLEEGRTMPSARYEAVRRSGERVVDFAVSRSAAMDDSTSDNGRRIRRDGTGAIISDERMQNEGDGMPYNLRGSFSTPAFGGKVRINASLGSDAFKGQAWFQSPGSEVYSLDRSSDREGEVGLTFDRPLGEQTTANLRLLHRMETDEYLGEYRDNADVSRFFADSTSGESIARVELKRTFGDSLRVEGGGEAAFNYLESEIALTDNGVPVLLPFSDVRVEERRGEIYGSLFWKPTSTVSLEGGVRVESSTISQSGDAAVERSFVYPKPRFVATWNPSENTQWRMRIEREVGQLDFGDFVSSAELSNDQVVSGNPELEPDKRWTIEASWERRFWDTGALVLTLRHAQVEDVIGRRPVFDTDGDFLFDSVGNIGEGTDSAIEANLTLPLGRLGITGGEFKANVALRDSELTDPATGQSRRFNGQRPDLVELTFRQDMPARKISYELSYYGGWEEARYGYDYELDLEIRHFFRAKLDYKPDPKTTFTAELLNLSRFEFERLRTQYQGVRGGSPIAYTEEISNRSQPRLMLRWRRQFG